MGSFYSLSIRTCTHAHAKACCDPGYLYVYIFIYPACSQVVGARYALGVGTWPDDRERADRQTAAVSLAQLQPSSTNTDTPHQYPEVYVWVMELQSSPWPLTSVYPSHTELYFHVAVLLDGI